jgi:hypothetical protein
VLLLYTVRAAGCSHLLLPDTLTALAIALIAGVGQGAGFAVREALQEEWVPPHAAAAPVSGEGTPAYRGPVRVVRPLRDLSAKECAAWAWWARLPLASPAPSPAGRPAAAIGSLTRGTPPPPTSHTHTLTSAAQRSSPGSSATTRARSRRSRAHAPSSRPRRTRARRACSASGACRSVRVFGALTGRAQLGAGERARVEGEDRDPRA